MPAKSDQLADVRQVKFRLLQIKPRQSRAILTIGTKGQFAWLAGLPRQLVYDARFIPAIGLCPGRPATFKTTG